MGISVTFYKNFSKRANSTKQPPNRQEHFTHSCVLKDGTSVFAPTLNIKMAANEYPYDLNYCWIGTFKRFYFVVDWTWDFGSWSCTLKCDVLASNKTAIGASTQYVLRSASEYDGAVIDSLYPTKSNRFFTSSIINGFTINQVPGYVKSGSDPYSSGGTYILGLISSDPGNLGACNYVAFNPGGLKTFFQKAFDTIPALLTNYNPISYVSSAIWIPYSLGTLQTAGLTTVQIEGIQLGRNTTLEGIYQERINNPIVRMRNSVTRPTHPQVSRGNYLNYAPFTEIQLYFRPYGLISIDSSKIGNTIYIEQLIDVTSGTGILNICADASYQVIVATAKSQIGTTIQLAQNLSNMYGLIGSAVSVGGGMAMAAAGNPAGLVTAASGIMSGLDAAIPQLKTTGSDGTFLSGGFRQSGTITSLEMVMIYKCNLLVDESLQDKGRPLCKNETISDLSGYVLCSDVEIELPITESERLEVKSKMEGGFFYE